MKEFIGKYVTIIGKGHIYDSSVSGFVLPTSDSSIVVIKLDSGYNVAINKDNIESIKIEPKEQDNTQSIQSAENPVSINKLQKKVAIISIGGTIASKVDYKTGGVSSQFSSEDLVRAIPEVTSIANIETFALRSIFSENVSNEDIVDLAKSIDSYIKKGFDGIIVTHGTDTMHYSASLISFMFESLGIPIVFVGSQRSSDRPSSDSAYNLVGALSFIVNTKKAGVFIAMHSTSDDNSIAVHLGVRARKMHSTSRDAFKSINSSHIASVSLDLRHGSVSDNSVLYDESYYNLNDLEKGLSKVNLNLSSEVAIVKFYQDMDADVFKYFCDKYKAVIIEGTGLGHISSRLISVAKKSKAILFITSQTIYGRVNLSVYSTGREMIEAGIIGLEDMTSESAYSKAKVALGLYSKREDIIKYMLTNKAQEISSSSKIINSLS